MELQNFTSLFEIFATFTLAYVLIDELTENPFISLICERILRKTKRIDDIHSNILSSVSGFRTSINNVPEGLNDVKVNEGIPKMQNLLSNVESRYSQFFLELRLKIKENYSTKVFVYLNSYLFLYCLSVLYLSGLYADDKAYMHNSCLNGSLFILNAGSVVVLIYGWFVDKREVSAQEKAHKSGYNGYKCMGIAFIVIVILSIIGYLTHFPGFPDKAIINNLLVQTAIFLPVSNFVIYFIKAARRANKTIPQLLIKANGYEESFNAEVKKVVNFLAMCDYVGAEDVEIVDAGHETK